MQDTQIVVTGDGPSAAVSRARGARSCGEGQRPRGFQDIF